MIVWSVSFQIRMLLWSHQTWSKIQSRGKILWPSKIWANVSHNTQIALSHITATKERKYFKSKKSGCCFTSVGIDVQHNHWLASGYTFVVLPIFTSWHWHWPHSPCGQFFLDAQQGQNQWGPMNWSVQDAVSYLWHPVFKQIADVLTPRDLR